MAAARSTAMKTFANQARLPRLPIPPIDATLAKYRETLTPILAPAELATTDRALRDFVRSGQAKRLQDRLVAYDRTQPHSWLENMWYRLAYLSWREPLMVNSNWWLFIRDEHHPDVAAAMQRRPHRIAGEFTQIQLSRAAGLVSNLLNYKELLESEAIPADVTRAGPLCMNQYKHMLGVTRIAEPDCDRIQTSFPCPARHMVVLVYDQCFRVELYAKDGRRLALADLVRQLEECVHLAKTSKRQPPIPILTAEHRDTWAKARAHLLSLASSNRDSMHEIETALFTLSLDDYAAHPQVLDEHHRIIAHGLDAHNRWFDKALNVIVTASGRGGCNGEHSPQDALTPAVMFEHVLSNEPAKDPQGCASAGTAQIAPIRHLSWTIDTTMEQYLRDAEVNNRKLLANSDIGILLFNDFGSNWMKRAKVSPDAFMQMALQLAYHSLHGKCVPTYETASTRAFLHGRTETCRTLSAASRAWCEAMADPTVDNARCASLFRAAADSHIKYITSASQGTGVDRHLLGLRMMLEKGESCPLFEDPAYARSSTWTMSTSGLGANSWRWLNGTGFGCVDPSGYGCNYFAGPDMIRFGLESKHSCPSTSTDLFRLHLVKALRRMRAMLEQESPQDHVPTQSKL